MLKTATLKTALVLPTALLLATSGTLELRSTYAQEPPAIRAEPNQDQGEIDTTEIDAWIEQLSDTSIIKRQEAREQLTAAGQQAVPALAKAALSDERDVIAASIEILGDIAQSADNDKAKEAARITLEMLAESEQPSTAERAKLALDTEKGGGIQAFPGWDKPGGEFAGRAGLGGNMSVSVSSSNGVKTITVTQGGRTTRLQDQPGGKIHVKIEDGDNVQEFIAKDLDDLKTKDEGAFALYKQHGSGGGFANMPGFGGLGALPGFGNVGGNAAQNSAKASDVQIAGSGPAREMATRALILQLLELKQRMAGNPEMQQMIDEQIKQLGGQ